MKITNTNSYDITFCASNCADKKCSRNKERAKNYRYDVAMQDFSKDCPDYKEKK